ncbi:MAG TPA: hypothetical protein K8V05_09095 [Butyricimonas virosa]|uniref:Uncharacterized protein n=1 Tax=Butyricimonas virosa TaxID=544645 RepID=A0A921KYN7_9BACT|nr:hypothetical protein [Butyricimonas virosa]
MKTYSIYRLGVKKHDFVIEDDDIRRSMSHDNNVSFNVESKDSLDIKIGDYIIEDGSHYTIYDPIDVEESNGVFSYPLVFRSPDYKLKFSIVKDEGATTFPYHGGIKEFVDLVILSLNEDQQEYTAGDIDEGNIIDLEFDNSSCFQALDDICEAANMEWNLIGTSINVKYRIGKDVDVVFEYGKEKGGYSVRLDKVQNTFIATRLIGKGGTVNLPKDYVSPDTPKRLNLGNDILEKNTDKYGKITGVYTNDNIFPRLINKTVLDVTIPEDIEKAVAWKLKLDIPFDLSQQYADDKVPIVKFQTGDLTGSEFEIVDNSWNNTDKTLQIIVQEEEDGYRLPNTSRQPRIGDVFVLLNINMPQSYIDEAEEELRKATQEELNKRSEPQYAPSVKVSKRFLTKKGYSLDIGDSITVKVGEHSINTRILAINQSSSSDEINYELGDEILYSYEDNVNNQIEQIQVTLKQLISLEDVRRLFNVLINQWRPLWMDQKLHTYDPVKFNSVTSTDFESKLKGWVIDALGNAEFRDVLLRSFKSWNFAAGPLGAGVGMVNDDELQTDKLLVRKIMYVLEMMIQRMRFQGGIMVLSPATGFKIDRVETFDTYYRVYCRPEDFNEFEVNDQARIQNFTGNNIKYLWSLVLSRGDDYIDISRVDKDGDGVPAEGDEIVQLGNRTNPDRQDAVLLSAVNGEVGIFTYYGINSFDLSNKEGSWLGKHGGKKGAVIRGEVHITAGSSGLEQFDEYEDVDKRIQDAKDLADSVQYVVNDLTSVIIPDLQGQIDGSIMSHEGTVPPTLTNEPAVKWTSEEEKNRHIGDYYDYFLTVDGQNVTERYKFSKLNGEYQWVRVADSGSALAASVAREALGLAGTKATITWGNTLPEAPYNINDMWIKLDGSMYICNHQRLDGETGSQSDWQLFNDTMLRLAKMADDNVITKEEKATLRDTWNQIQKEFTAYQAQATKYGVSITALQNAYNTLNTFLTNTVKIAQDIDSNLSVAQKTEYNQDFANYYSERTAFANVIAQKVADESVGNLQIGGINLADYSGGNFLDVLGLYDSSYASKTKIEGKTCLQFNRNSANCRFAHVMVEDGEYTFSLWVKGSEEYDAQVNHYNGSNYGATTVHVTTSWERKVITFTAKAGSDIIHFGTKNTIYITDWKYEKGNKATDWSPSIADQNRYATEQGIIGGQDAVNNLQIGSVNLVSRKILLDMNNTANGSAIWGQDSDGIYISVAPKDNTTLYSNFKNGTQYVISVNCKGNPSGGSSWRPYLIVEYTDSTKEAAFLIKDSVYKRYDYISKQGKTIARLYWNVANPGQTYSNFIYSLALYEGNKVLAEPPVATEDLTGQSNVNLVDGGKEVTVASQTYKTLKVPVIKPNTVYSLRFTNAEVISGDIPSGYEFRLYDTSLAESQRYARGTIKAGMNSGLLITNNNFTAREGRLLFYPGIQSEGLLRSVKFTEIMLVEGFTPPASWSPSAGDVQKEFDEINNRLGEWASDGYISPQEKTALRQQKSDIQAEKNEIEANANRFSISLASYMSAYDAAIAALDKYTATSPENIAVGSDYNNIAAYYPARQTILNSIAAAAKAQADKATGAIGMDGGKMLYADPEFKKGLNGVAKYTNSSNVSPDYIASKLTVERVTKPSDAPTQSGYCLKVTCKAAQAPGHGGVYQYITSRANAVFVQKIIAKIPVGYKINTASNSMGAGYSDTWLTPTEGTGKYTTYLRKVVCGATGTFSVGGHVYISGGPAPTESDPLEWYIAYMTAFDLTADGYGDIEFSAKDDLAQQLGYSNFDKMVENASKGETIIKGAYINTKLIDVETLVADTALVDKLSTNILKAGSITANMISVGGFEFQNGQIYGGSDFGTGPGVKITSKDEERSFKAYKDENNYISLFYNNDSDWGLIGKVDGSELLKLGKSSEIGGFSLANGRIGTISSINNPTKGMSLYDSFIKFKDDDVLAMIGVNTIPSSTGFGVVAARFEVSTVWASSAPQCNVALKLDSTGHPNTYTDAGRNYAIYANNGLIVSRDAIIDYRYYELSNSGPIRIDRGKIVMLNLSSLTNVYLPTLAHIRKVLFLDSSASQAFMIKISIFTYNASARLYPSDGCTLYNENGSAITYLSLEKGDAVDIVLWSGGGNFVANIAGRAY